MFYIFSPQAGYVWAYNTQVYFDGLGQTPTQIGSWMSWIPIVGGSIGKCFKSSFVFRVFIVNDFIYCLKVLFLEDSFLTELCSVPDLMEGYGYSLSVKYFPRHLQQALYSSTHLIAISVCYLITSLVLRFL